MKKSFPVNISGTVFNVDEDAYELLNNYLDQLRKAFPDNEGSEIVNDIEDRISEIFCESCGGSRVVTINDVNLIIEKMGKPVDISDGDDSADFDDPTTPPPYPGAASAPTAQPAMESGGHKKLFRDMQDKVLGGVLGGLAVYLGWNANIMRVLVIILAVSTHVWPAFVCYLVAWMVIPPARTMRQVLEMRGERVTVDSVSQSVLNNIASENASKRGFITTFLSIIAKIVLIFFGLIGVCVGLGAMAIVITVLCGLIVFAVCGSTTLLENIDIYETGASVWVYGGGALCVTLAVLLPCALLGWYCIRSLNHQAHLPQSTIITLTIIEIALIIGGVVLLNVAEVTILLASTMTAGACTLYLC